MTSRQLSPYEKTHLARFGKGRFNMDAYGEMPVEYITGQVEFCGQVFAVTPATLIPRVETEELVNLSLAEAQRLSTSQRSLEPMSIAEIGTGCGAIAISLHLALQRQQLTHRITASDISPKALAVARQNATTLLGQNHPLTFVESDLLEHFPTKQTFDLIIANLPYIPSQRIEFLDESVKNYEPHLALDGGEDGLQYIKKLLTQAAHRLTSTGSVLLEVDYTHSEEFLRRQLVLNTQTLHIIEDQFSRTRFAVIKPKSATIK